MAASDMEGACEWRWREDWQDPGFDQGQEWELLFKQLVSDF
jgi:hypothetical protein